MNVCKNVRRYDDGFFIDYDSIIKVLVFVDDRCLDGTDCLLCEK